MDYINPQNIPSNLNLTAKKKSLARKDNFAHSFMPIYYFSRLLGLLPFSIIAGDSGEMLEARVSACDLFWCMISICLYLFMAYHYSFQTLRNEYLIWIIGDRLLIISGLIFGGLRIIMDMYNRGKIVTTLKMFTIFDREVRISFHVIFKLGLVIFLSFRLEIWARMWTIRKNDDAHSFFRLELQYFQFYWPLQNRLSPFTRN